MDFGWPLLLAALATGFVMLLVATAPAFLASVVLLTSSLLGVISKAMVILMAIDFTTTARLPAYIFNFNVLDGQQYSWERLVGWLLWTGIAFGTTYMLRRQIVALHFALLTQRERVPLNMDWDLSSQQVQRKFVDDDDPRDRVSFTPNN